MSHSIPRLTSISIDQGSDGQRLSCNPIPTIILPPSSMSDLQDSSFYLMPVELWLTVFEHLFEHPLLHSTFMGGNFDHYINARHATDAVATLLLMRRNVAAVCRFWRRIIMGKRGPIIDLSSESDESFEDCDNSSTLLLPSSSYNQDDNDRLWALMWTGSPFIKTIIYEEGHGTLENRTPLFDPDTFPALTTLRISWPITPYHTNQIANCFPNLTQLELTGGCDGSVGPPRTFLLPRLETLYLVYPAKREDEIQLSDWRFPRLRNLCLKVTRRLKSSQAPMSVLWRLTSKVVNLKLIGASSFTKNIDLGKLAPLVEQLVIDGIIQSRTKLNSLKQLKLHGPWNEDNVLALLQKVPIGCLGGKDLLEVEVETKHLETFYPLGKCSEAMNKFQLAGVRLSFIA